MIVFFNSIVKNIASAHKFLVGQHFTANKTTQSSGSDLQPSTYPTYALHQHTNINTDPQQPILNMDPRITTNPQPHSADLQPRSPRSASHVLERIEKYGSKAHKATHTLVNNFVFTILLPRLRVKRPLSNFQYELPSFQCM
jgi:hypothetical protein